MERIMQIYEKTFSEFNALGCNKEKKNTSYTHSQRNTQVCHLGKEGAP